MSWIRKLLTWIIRLGILTAAVVVLVGFAQYSELGKLPKQAQMHDMPAAHRTTSTTSTPKSQIPTPAYAVAQSHMYKEQLLQKQNKQHVMKFFALQNQMADVKLIRHMFADHYQISDLAALDVKPHAAADIEARITNFRAKFPGYQVDIEHIIAEGSQVFVWFKVVLKDRTLLLNSFALFSLQQHKITRVVEMVSMKKPAK